MAKKTVNTPKAAYKSTAKVVISFGMIAAPVKLYKASEDVDIHFNQLHSTCGHRLKQQPMYCPHCSDREGSKVEVAKEEIIKGFEVADNSYVTFTDEEIASATMGKDSKVVIKEFVPADSLDPIYFDGDVQFVGPDNGGEKALALIANALAKTNRVAIAQMVSRGRLRLVALRSMMNSGGYWSLVMQNLRYNDEVRDACGIPGFDTPVTAEELDLATLLVAKATSEKFNPDKYTDAVRIKLYEMIDAKKTGAVVEIINEKGYDPASGFDLAAALRATLESIK